MKGKFTDLHANDVVFVPGKPILDHELNSMALQLSKHRWANPTFKIVDKLVFAEFDHSVMRVEFGAGAAEQAQIPADNNKVEISIVRKLVNDQLRYFAIPAVPKVKLNTIIKFVPKQELEGCYRLEMASAKDGKRLLKWSSDNAQRFTTSLPVLEANLGGKKPKYLEIESKHGVSLGIRKYEDGFDEAEERIRIWDGIEELPSDGIISEGARPIFEVVEIKSEKQTTDFQFWIIAGTNLKRNEVCVVQSQDSIVWSGKLSRNGNSLNVASNNRVTRRRLAGTHVTDANPVESQLCEHQQSPTRYSLLQKTTANKTGQSISIPETSPSQLSRWISSIELLELAGFTKDELFSQIKLDLGLKKVKANQWDKALDEVLAQRDAMLGNLNPETTGNQEVIV